MSACPKPARSAATPICGRWGRARNASKTLSDRFPQARVLRIDRDSTRRKNAWDAMRSRIRARDVDVLVGTQILAKGHDFPHLRSRRAQCRQHALQRGLSRGRAPLCIAHQVAGRAGRGESQGEVLIQTEYPAHPLYAALRDQDFRRFADQLLAERRQARFPPFVHQACCAPRHAKSLARSRSWRMRGRSDGKSAVTSSSSIRCRP